MSTSPNIPLKTPDGVAELSQRVRKLSQRHRTVLLLADGRRDEAQVRQMAVMAGAHDRCFDELVAMGLIVVTEPVPKTAAVRAEVPVASTPPPTAPAPGGEGAIDVDLAGDGEDSVGGVLTPSLSLQYDTMAGDLMSSGFLPGADLEDLLEQARRILIGALRAEAPVTGSLTMLRLRRAHSRDDIAGLLDEVEVRLSRVDRGEWVTQTLDRVRELLHSHAVQSMPMPLA